ncbi:MAG: hypothetical protein H6919_11785 [Sphingomonadaceae bacterium]|nr:hypothetical protein [Sphingomonadaceae bacterium]
MNLVVILSTRCVSYDQPSQNIVSVDFGALLRAGIFDRSQACGDCHNPYRRRAVKATRNILHESFPN